MQADTLSGGFAAPPVEAAHAFRAIMRVMARPGTIEDVAGATPPAPLSVAAGTVLLTLCDPETPVYLAGTADCAGVRDWITFHTGAPLVTRAEAMFAIGTWEALMPLDDYAVGTSEYPDRSATLIVEMERLEATGARLTGPGIADTAALSLPESAAFQANARQFPLGLDFLFTCGDRLAALPRTTRVEAS
ncbi:phosphonate C-P lyase system protein PhnH [uncultured Roseovarius sp.]|uniref:phosphonate C-P lyase system protein PhnH n=1 Tax=uncultured Roseovarius sp. TaxID=293344 RepID=UPI00261715FC|nr:phosphonate C-P lyase system protein PhnH [uncultured Roseovarius sp.]